MFSIVLRLQFQLFVMMAAGYITGKIGILGAEARKSLSDLLLYVILPCNILQSFTSGITVSSDLLKNCALAVAISLVIQLITIYSSKLIFRRWPKEKSSVASYGMIVSNSSFIGVPVSESLYGSLGVLYMAIFQIPIRFTMWSAGLSLFTKVDFKTTVKKTLTHPCIIACAAGLVMLILNLRLPGFLGDACQTIGRCTGALSMIVIGAILSTADVHKLFQKDVLIFCAIRLVIFPGLVFLALRLLNADPALIGVCLISTALPAGSTTAILAQKYDCDARYGATLILVSTIFSTLTFPVLGLLLDTL